ncbi:hypothetical protein [Streptomyces sp. NPDC047315]|uniref:hypothetical protein n=1 Tax=Streptomyces sp. NPDC047315 TaxID=3155142 RepID=UPI0033ECCDB0
MNRPHPQAAEIDALLHAGHTNAAIASALGVGKDKAAARRTLLGLPGYYARRTDPTCRHGHPWPQHLRISPKGKQYCAACRSERKATRRRPREVDTIAVARAVAGDPPAHLPAREREAAVLRLTDLGESARMIAVRVRCTPRTVARIRARRRAGTRLVDAA